MSQLLSEFIKELQQAETENGDFPIFISGGAIPSVDFYDDENGKYFLID